MSNVGERVTEQIINFIVCSFSADVTKKGEEGKNHQIGEKWSTKGGVACSKWIILTGHLRAGFIPACTSVSTCGGLVLLTELCCLGGLRWVENYCHQAVEPECLSAVSVN